MIDLEDQKNIRPTEMPAFSDYFADWRSALILLISMAVAGLFFVGLLPAPWELPYWLLISGASEADKQSLTNAFYGISAELIVASLSIPFAMKAKRARENGVRHG